MQELYKYESGLENPLFSFIRELTLQRFHNCTSVILNDRLINKPSHLNYLLNELPLPNYLVEINTEESLKRESLNDTFSDQHSFRFPSGFGLFNLRRFSNNCMLAVVIMHYVSSDAVTQIREIISPTFIPIIRKDVDHYVYVAPPANHKELLLMQELPNRSKFKLAVGIDDRDGLIKINTVDFFGGPGASFRIVEFSSINGLQEDVDYFPDFLWNLHGALIRISLPITIAFLQADPNKFLNNGIRGRWLYFIEGFLMVFK